MTEILKKLNISYQLTGVDFNPLRLKRVKERFPEVEVREFDLLKDNFGKKFDIVIFNHVLEHIKDDELALQKLYDLVAGGIVILGVPNEGCLIAKLRNHRLLIIYIFILTRSLEKR